MEIATDVHNASGMNDLDLDILMNTLLPEHDDHLGMNNIPNSSGSPTETTSDSSHGTPTGKGESDEPSERKRRRREQVADSGRRHRMRKKQERTVLHQQVSELSTQLESIRSARLQKYQSPDISRWAEYAGTERKNREQSEATNVELRRAVLRQGSFLANLRSMLSISTRVSADFEFHQLLHTECHLGVSEASRQREFERLSSPDRVDLAIDLLERATGPAEVSTKPVFKTMRTHSPDHFLGLMSTSVFAFDTLDINSIFNWALAGFANSEIELGEKELLQTEASVYAAPSNQTKYFGATLQIIDGQRQVECQMEMRTFVVQKLTNEYAIVTWDYVDDDKLYPLHAQTRVKRDCVGGALVRLEECMDGKKRVVCRMMCTKLHKFASRDSVSTTSFSQSIRTSCDAALVGVYNHIKENTTSIAV